MILSTFGYFNTQSISKADKFSSSTVPDETFYMISVCSMVAYGASCVRALMSLAVVSSPQRAALYTTIVLCGIATHCHYIMAYDKFIIFDSCFKRPMHVARLADWVSAVFLITAVSTAVDCPGLNGAYFRFIGRQLISVCTGALSILSCYISNVSRGTCKPNKSTSIIPLQNIIAIGLLAVSCYLHADLFSLSAAEENPSSTQNQARFIRYWEAF